MKEWIIGALALLWIVAMRFRYRSTAFAIDEALVHKLSAWFAPDLLRDVRVCRPESVRLLLFGIARRLGLSFLSGQPRGLCLGKLILIDHEVQSFEELLFHELVHTVQWNQLGGPRFLGRYINQVRHKGYFDSTGLEEEARVLTDQFVRGEVFLVDEKIRLMRKSSA